MSQNRDPGRSIGEDKKKLGIYWGFIPLNICFHYGTSVALDDTQLNKIVKLFKVGKRSTTHRISKIETIIGVNIILYADPVFQLTNL